MREQSQLNTNHVCQFSDEHPLRKARYTKDAGSGKNIIDITEKNIQQGFEAMTAINNSITKSLEVLDSRVEELVAQLNRLNKDLEPIMKKSELRVGNDIGCTKEETNSSDTRNRINNTEDKIKYVQAIVKQISANLDI